jgi:hypothetical protein
MKIWDCHRVIDKDLRLSQSYRRRSEIVTELSMKIWWCHTVAEKDSSLVRCYVRYRQTCLHGYIVDSVYKNVLGNSYTSSDLTTPTCEWETAHKLHTNCTQTAHKLHRNTAETGRRLQEGCILQHSVCVELEWVYSEGIYQSARRNIVENLNLQQINPVSLRD